LGAYCAILKKPETTRTYEKKYPCIMRKTSFTILKVQSNVRKLHARSYTGGKPHICGVCMKSFAQSTYLKQHEITHTGEKPHTCGV